MALPATEDFTGTAGPLAGSWTQQRSSGTVNKNGSGVGTWSSSGQQEVYAFWNADAFNADQYSQCTVANLASGARYAEVIVRAAGTTDATFDNYLFATDGASGSGHTEIAKYINGTYTTLVAVNTTVAAGDVIRLEVSGSTLTAFKNGAQVAQTTDTDLTSGAAGVGVFDLAQVDNWEGGNLGGGAVAKVRGAAVVGDRRTRRRRGARMRDAIVLKAQAATTTAVGDAGLTVPPLSLSAQGTVAIDGASALTLPPLTLTASGAVGSVTAVRPAITIVAATSSARLTRLRRQRDPLLLVGYQSAPVGIIGTGGLTVPPLSLSATGAVAIDGAAALTVPPLTLASTGTVGAGAFGDAGLTLPPLTLVASGSVAVAGGAALTVPSLVLTSVGAVTIEGAATLTLPALTLVASDLHVVPVGPPLRATLITPGGLRATLTLTALRATP